MKMDGVLMLYHNPNEAESEAYSGFHQYNFDVVDGRFIIWRGDQRWDVERNCRFAPGFGPTGAGMSLCRSRRPRPSPRKTRPSCVTVWRRRRAR